MKVLHVVNGHHLFGGARQVAYLIDGLRARGVDNVLVSPGGSALETMFAPRGVPTHAAHCRSGLHLHYLARLVDILRRERPSLLHAHSRLGSDTLAGLAARLTGTPAVLSRRVDDREPRIAARRKYPMFATTICISRGIAGVLRDCGVDPARLRVVRSAIDPQDWRHGSGRSALCARFGLTSERVLAACVAQLIPRKGHATLFEALSGLPPEQRPQVVLFGRGAHEPALRSEVDARGLSADVVFAGYVDALSAWLADFDLMVHPALAEGLGVALLQAGAAGLPLVASAVGGIPEIVRDRETGLLVAPGDAVLLRRALAVLIRDPAQRRRLGAGARAWVDAEFSVEAMIDGNLACYRDVLGGSR